MDPIRFDGDVRLLRLRRTWTQEHLATEVKVSRWAVAEVEAGHAPRMAAQDLVKIVAALGGYLTIRIVYQCEGLDRLRDRGHAALVGPW